MSSCLSGAGGRTYALDLEIIKSPSYSTRTSHTSSPSPSPSPSSTLSEASNSPLAISTRKARTPRKRPKQTYNEAAALLSTAYPNIFSRKHLASLNKYTSKPPHDHHHQQQQQLFDESSQLLLPFRVFDDSGFLLHQPIPDKPRSPFEPKVTNFCQIKSCQTSGEVDFQGNDSMEVQISSEFDEDFDADSILDEEIGEGIDSIMGNLQVKQDTIESSDGQVHNSYCYGNPVGIGFGGKVEPGFGLRSGMRALRPVDEGNWWNFPIDVLQISPKFNHSSHGNGNGKSNKKVSSEKKKKKVEKEKHVAESKVVELPTKEENSTPKANSRELLLKLQYDDVLNAWSDKGSPFLDESLGSNVPGYDVSARLAQIDLFSESGVREASVLRYKEKRRARLFSKKIRYQVRKVNADRRPRMKGRFVRRPNSSGQDEKGKKKAIMLSDL